MTLFLLFTVQLLGLSISHQLDFCSLIAFQVSVFEMQVMRPGGSPAMALLVDLGQQCKTARQLAVWLKKIKNDDALEILGYVGKYSLYKFALTYM